MDLSSHGVTDEIQLGYHSLNLREHFYLQISTTIIEKSILFNTVEGMHDNVTNYVYAYVFMVNDYDRHH